MPGALAFRYARALADAAHADPQAVLAELSAFDATFDAMPHLRIALDSPAVSPPRKRAVIQRLAKQAPFSGAVTRFLMVLADHRRIPLLDEIREAFQAVIDERSGVVRVEVSSAREMAPQQRDEIVAGFNRLTGKRAVATFSLDPELIGGVLARADGAVYDGSVRGQLEGLKQRMAGAGD
jgi:F-type H+-transporting ATPase subunit delta